MKATSQNFEILQGFINKNLNGTPTTQKPSTFKKRPVSVCQTS